MDLTEVRIGDFLKRIKEPIRIEDSKEYSLVTIRMFHKGVVKRGTLSGKEIKSKTLYSVKSGQFILSGIDARNSAFGIVPNELNGAVVSNDFWTHNIDDSIVDLDYFYWLTNTQTFINICKEASEGTTNRQRLQSDVFYNHKIFVPNKKKQKEILKTIEKLNNNYISISSENRLQTALIKKLSQGILQEAFQGNLTKQTKGEKVDLNSIIIIEKEKNKLIEKRRLRPNNVEEHHFVSTLKYEIPKNWYWFKLDDVVFFQEGPGIRNWQFTSEGTKLLNVENITKDGLVLESTNKYISQQEFEEKYSHFKIEEGDILYASSGGSWGKSCWFKKPNYDVVLNTSTMRFKTYSEKLLLNKYLWYYLQTDFVKQQLIPQLVGMQPNFGSTHFSRIYIPVAPVIEQKEIVTKVEELMNLCDQLEKEVTSSKLQVEKLIQSVLREAFENKKEIVDAV